LNGTSALRPTASPSEPATLVDVVRSRARTDGERIAYTFLADGFADVHSITWSQLDQRATALAAVLRDEEASGQPVLLALPSGLEFVQSLFACWYAGAIAVPASLPRHHRVKHRLEQIILNSTTRFGIASADVQQRICADDSNSAATANLKWIAPDAIVNPNRAVDVPAATEKTAGQNPAILQYTSGSTGTPRGVVVTHSNLLHNSAQIAQACGHAPGTTIAGWLPLFHDMGLVGLVIQAAFSGARCVFMPPERFLMRPWLWLRMICDYKACSSPAPNFAYDLCVDRVGDEHKEGLDLSCWRNALNGSEPVRAKTLDRFASAFSCCGFRREAFFSCYGLAEATLFVTGPGEVRRGVRRTADGSQLPENAPGGHVGCGHTYGDTQLAIVDPQTCRPLPHGSIGEIWIAGKSCADGYWNDPQATAITFNAQLNAPADNAGRWLRTGDLGFIKEGDLFITGRLRELIIIAGRNHFPVDLERTIESAEPAIIAPSAAAAFSIDTDGLERLIVVAEVRREYGRAPRADAPPAFDAEAVRRRLCAAVAAEHELMPHDLILLRPGALPRTTSGKISRAAIRQAYMNQTLELFEGSTHVRTDA
jgi:acyl-CoA synthetase (AMP-forming)/AMP-acid ligase II